MQESFSAQVYSILVIKVKKQFLAAAKESVNNNNLSTASNARQPACRARHLCLPRMSAMPPAHVSHASRA
jgi:hypothetical protein